MLIILSAPHIYTIAYKAQKFCGWHVCVFVCRSPRLGWLSLRRTNPVAFQKTQAYIHIYIQVGYIFLFTLEHGNRLIVVLLCVLVRSDALCENRETKGTHFGRVKRFVINFLIWNHSYFWYILFSFIIYLFYLLMFVLGGLM